MLHPVQEAALAAGFLRAESSSAHPYALWREKADALTPEAAVSLEHRPAALCGWQEAETTVWTALYPTPPFGNWPEGFGQVSGYYFVSQRAREAALEWETAVRALGLETLARPALPARAAAIRAKLGVHGLNGPLITPEGSFVYIAVLLVRSPPPDGAPGPEADPSPGCEQCGRCARACPAGAIGEHGLNPARCLRHFMSRPEQMDESVYPLMGGRILGCETCQLACPHNADVPRMKPDPDQYEPFDLEALLTQPDTDAIARLIGKNYARKGRLALWAVLAAANTDRTDLSGAIRAHLTSEYEPLRRAAQWANERLKQKTKER